MFCVAGNAVRVGPKLDFDDTSPGISPEKLKTFLEKEETSVKSGVVKAILEVKVGDSVVTDNYPTKPDKKGHKDDNGNKILLCSLKDDCKIYEIRNGESYNDDNKDEGSGKKKLNPVIVTDFNEDPLKDNENGDNRKTGKKRPTVPVIVGYRGAVKDDDFSYAGYGQGLDRLPAYYGLKLSPEFHQPYPGPIVYEERPRPLPRQALGHGSYPHYRNLPCMYPHYAEQRYPVPGISDHSRVRPHVRTSLSGHEPRTPSPYGNVHPTSGPGSFHAIITPLATRRPAVYWPRSKPTAPPAVVAVHGKTQFDEDELSVGVIGPVYPDSGNGNVKVDGKLGEPLNVSEA